MPRGGLQTSMVSMVNMLAAPFRRRITGPRRAASAGRGAPICRAPVGLTYRGARLADKTHGTLNAARSNLIVYPTSYGAQHPDLEWLIAPGKPVDSWEANFRRRDANDLLAMLWTWQPHADNSANELAAATSIKHWVRSPPTRP